MSFTVVQVCCCQRNRVILPMIKQVIEKGIEFNLETGSAFVY
jgi:hypothetical protein